MKIKPKPMTLREEKLLIRKRHDELMKARGVFTPKFSDYHGSRRYKALREAK